MRGEDGLITGATGFVGRHLVEHLTEQGLRLRALVRPTSDTGHLEARGVRCIKGDLEDAGSLREAARDVRYIFHLAEIAMRVPDSARKNIEAARVLAETARTQSGFARFVFLSSLTVASVPSTLPADEETPTDPSRLVDDYYTRYKRGMEQALAESRVPAGVVRAGGIYGPGAFYLVKFLNACRKARIPLPFPGRLDIKLATIHVKDLASALYRAAAFEREPFRIFHASDDADGTARVFLYKLAGAAGVKVSFWQAPYGMQLIAARILDSLTAIRRRGKNFTGIVRYMGFDQRFENRRIKEELGLQLRYARWEDGIPETGAWLRRQLSI